MPNSPLAQVGFDLSSNTVADKERTREERALHKGIPEYCLGKLTLKGWLSPIKQLFYPPLGNLKCLMRTQTTAAVIVSDQQVFF